jgi:hypothetical protein
MGLKINILKPDERSTFSCFLHSLPIFPFFIPTEGVSMLSSWDKELLGNLQNLSLVTWKANDEGNAKCEIELKTAHIPYSI